MGLRQTLNAPAQVRGLGLLYAISMTADGFIVSQIAEPTFMSLETSHMQIFPLLVAVARK